MVNEISQEKAKIICDMEQHLKSDLLFSKQEKLWEHALIKMQIDKRNKKDKFCVKDHIRAMVYSMLSAGRKWDCIVTGAGITTGYLKSVDEIFYDYNSQQLLKCTPKQLRESLKEIHCASRYTFKQMDALISVNIPKLIELKEKYGTIDNYYDMFMQKDETLITLVKALSEPKSKDKMAQLGVALASEYLRNIGYDIPKPDRHICRILGSDYLAFSSKKNVPPIEVFEIIRGLAEKLNKSVAEVDYILWSYCADGYGEICTKKDSKCTKCVAKAHCNRYSCLNM